MELREHEKLSYEEEMVLRYLISQVALKNASGQYIGARAETVDLDRHVWSKCIRAFFVDLFGDETVEKKELLDALEDEINRNIYDRFED